MQNKLMMIGDKLGSQRHLQSVSKGLMTILPLTVFGSIFQIIYSLPQIFPFIPAYSEKVSEVILYPYTITFGLFGLISVLAIAYYHASNYGLNQLQAVVISGLTFIIVVAKFDGSTLDMTYIGATGMFSAIFISLITVEIIHLLMKKNIRLKLPESIPQVAAAAFDAIIPMMVVVVFFYGLNLICQALTGDIMPTFIMHILSPAIKGSESLWFCLLAAFLINLFGFFGVHGFNVLAGIILPLLIANTAENAAAFAAGETATKLFTLPMFQMSGTFYWVIPLLFLRCKSEKLRAIGKVSLVPSIFNIGEPIQYGAPIMLNPILGIPYVAYSTINMGIIWCFMYFDWMDKAVVAVASTIPMPAFQYLATFDIRSFIPFILMLVVSYVVWKPFISVYDRHCLKEEETIANGNV